MSQAILPTHSPRPRVSPLARKRALTGLIFISPWLFGLVLLKLLPILASLVLSFTDFNMLRPDETRFVGLVNYLQIFRDQEAGFNFFSTLAQALMSVPLQLFASLGLAALLNSERLEHKTLLRTLFFLPSIVPAAAIFSIWAGFLDPSTGWLNRLILQPLGWPTFLGIRSEAAANLFLTISALWSIGPGLLIMLGAMQGVPHELYEAARVDGAGPVWRFIRITVPMISPAIFFSLVIDLISVFGGVALLDRGNPFSGSASAFDGYIYQVMFHSNQLGYAASLAWLFFVLMLIVTLVLFRTSSRWVFYAEEEKE
ncbi:MAG TPA: sugar ABC transporter permease [Anaerolineae bacterium]